MVMIFVALGILLLLPDAYILFSVLSRTSWWLRALFLLPTAAYFVAMIRVFATDDMRQDSLNMLFWLTLCVVFPILIFALISLLGRAIGLIWPNAPAAFNITGAVVALAWLSISLYGIIFGWKKITVTDVGIKSAVIPKAFEGYRIVQLSDFHIGTYSSAPESVDRIVDRVNSLHPDLIVFTGDLVNSSADEIDRFKPALSRLQASDGIYSVLGNHDYCLYRKYVSPDSPDRQLRQVIASEKELGWHLLRNESIQIKRGNDSIALIGVDNAGSGAFPDKSDLRRATAGLTSDEFKILLSHDPSHWRREVLPGSDINLMLAGHTHAMQFEIAGWSPSAWIYPEWGGLYNENDRNLYVSTGIGENIAFRFGAWPQIVLLTLHN